MTLLHSGTINLSQFSGRRCFSSFCFSFSSGRIELNRLLTISASFGFIGGAICSLSVRSAVMESSSSPPSSSSDDTDSVGLRGLIREAISASESASSSRRFTVNTVPFRGYTSPHVTHSRHSFSHFSHVSL